eukprot:749753-Prymnesium_polylepis.1
MGRGGCAATQCSAPDPHCPCSDAHHLAHLHPETVRALSPRRAFADIVSYHWRGPGRHLSVDVAVATPARRRRICGRRRRREGCARCCCAPSGAQKAP